MAKLIESKSAEHFDAIAGTWQQKGWVHSNRLATGIDRAVREWEKYLQSDLRGKHRSALYLGIGTGALVPRFRRYAIAGVDQALGMLKQCPQGVVQLLGDAEELPYLPNGQFNLALSRNLLKHCPEPREALATMHAKIRPGAMAVIAESVVMDPAHADIPTQLVRMTDPHHARFLAANDVEEMMKKVGFTDIKRKVIPFRAPWLKKWLAAEQASTDVHQEVLAMYHGASQEFRAAHRVVFTPDGDIISTVPWLVAMGRKAA